MPPLGPEARSAGQRQGDVLGEAVRAGAVPTRHVQVEGALPRLPLPKGSGPLSHAL